MLSRHCTILACSGASAHGGAAMEACTWKSSATLLARHARPDWTTAIDGVLDLEGRPPRPTGTVHVRHGPGGHRPGRQTACPGRPGLRVRPRAVPGRVGRPACDGTVHAGRPRAAGAGVRAHAGPVRRRRVAAPGGPRRHPPRRRRRTFGDRRQRRSPRAARRGGPAAAPARRTPRPRRAGPAGQAGDPVARDHRRAGRDSAPARSRRQQPQPCLPGRALDPRALRGALPGRGRGADVRHERLRLLPQLPGGDRDEPHPVPEADPAAGGPAAARHPPGDVTGVGHRVGYDNPSQFSREYRRQFGAPPSQDAARLRAAVRTHAGVLP